MEEAEKQQGNSQRVIGTPFPPGVSGNPAGRPKKENTFSDIAREMLKSKVIDITYKFPKDGMMVSHKMHMESDKTMNHSLAAVLIKEGMAGNVKAIQEIIDRTQGKPKQEVDVTTNGENVTDNKWKFVIVDKEPPKETPPPEPAE